MASSQPAPRPAAPPPLTAPATTAPQASSAQLAVVPQVEEEEEDDPITITEPQNFRDVAEMFKERHEMLIYGQIYNFISPIKFEIGKLEIYLDHAADRTIPGQLSKMLAEWTGQRWVVTVVTENKKTDDHITLAETDKRIYQQKLANAARHPIVEEVLEHFPGAKIIKLQDITE